MKNMVFFVVRRKKKLSPHFEKKNFFEERPGRVFFDQLSSYTVKEGEFFR